MKMLKTRQHIETAPVVATKCYYAAIRLEEGDHEESYYQFDAQDFFDLLQQAQEVLGEQIIVLKSLVVPEDLPVSEDAIVDTLYFHLTGYLDNTLLPTSDTRVYWNTKEEDLKGFYHIKATTPETVLLEAKPHPIEADINDVFLAEAFSA